MNGQEDGIVSTVAVAVEPPTLPGTLMWIALEQRSLGAGSHSRAVLHAVPSSLSSSSKSPVAPANPLTRMKYVCPGSEHQVTVERHCGGLKPGSVQTPSSSLPPTQN